MKRLWVAAVGAHLADLLTTIVGLSVGLSERHPAGTAALDTAGLAGLAGLKIAAFLGLLALFSLGRAVLGNRAAQSVPAVASVAGAAASVWNAMLILSTIGVVA
jgi:hypothetical protein